ncbi:hypothetical protein D3C75_706300 [compost metagenome]
MQHAIRTAYLGGTQEGDDFFRIKTKVEFFLQRFAGSIRELQTVEQHMIYMEHQPVDRFLLDRIMSGQRHR